jgi:hypothetical protein
VRSKGSFCEEHFSLLLWRTLRWLLLDFGHVDAEVK